MVLAERLDVERHGRIGPADPPPEDDAQGEADDDEEEIEMTMVSPIQGAIPLPKAKPRPRVEVGVGDAFAGLRRPPSCLKGTYAMPAFGSHSASCSALKCG